MAHADGSEAFHDDRGEVVRPKREALVVIGREECIEVIKNNHRGLTTVGSLHEHSHQLLPHRIQIGIGKRGTVHELHMGTSGRQGASVGGSECKRGFPTSIGSMQNKERGQRSSGKGRLILRAELERDVARERGKYLKGLVSAHVVMGEAAIDRDGGRSKAVDGRGE